MVLSLTLSCWVVWGIGVVTCAYAAWRSADDQRKRLQILSGDVDVSTGPSLESLPLSLASNEATPGIETPDSSSRENETLPEVGESYTNDITANAAVLGAAADAAAGGADLETLNSMFGADVIRDLTLSQSTTALSQSMTGGADVGHHDDETLAAAADAFAAGADIATLNNIFFLGMDLGTDDDPAMALTTLHACGFILFAAGMVLVVFFTNLYVALDVCFALAAVWASAKALWYPLFSLPRVSTGKVIQSKLTGTITRGHVAAFIASKATAIIWYLIRDATHAWVLQDIIGACIVVAILGQIRLNNIKVATLLLTLAFLYDTFFVFISPLVFHGSDVMAEVAGAGREQPDDDLESIHPCVPHANDDDCVIDTSESGTNAFMIRVPDRTSEMMLGLGDLVLPGLLLSFAMRYDVSISRRIPHHFLVTMMGYTAGLLTAMTVMTRAESAQPALLYLVPSTLGTFCLLSWREGSLRLMWQGPPSLNPDSNDSADCCTCMGRGRARQHSSGQNMFTEISQTDHGLEIPLVTEPQQAES